MALENNSRTVLAGDIIDEPTEMMKESKKVILGPGLRIEKDTVRASKCGQLKMKAPNTFWIDAYQKRYVPNRGELVIGVVMAKAGDIFRLDIGSCENASLSYMAFEGATKKNRPDVNVGDIVYARLLIAHPDVEPELVCVDSHGKKGKLGVLHEGFMLCCSLNLVRKILNPKCTFLAQLAKELPFEMAAGMNGRIWIRGRTIKETIGVGNAILALEYLPSDRVRELCDDIGAYVSGFIK
ncbi:exosome complex component RRP40 [Anopheles stephensi]|uniref:Exosome complex component RRP40 n=1 Tax=Anopheles stephensi TaxID=30069 RepID=A0A182YHF8_ANOST|nr:exosome complex component RRP40 [Anopheles stephensi]